MHIAVVCRGLGLAGSVAAVALRQSRELARHDEVTLVSDSFPPATPGSRRQTAPVPDLDLLRRFRHVPDEIVFARAARKALFRAHRELPVDFVLCQGHALAYLAARPFSAVTAVPYGFFVHGDISDRPKGTYDFFLTAFYRWVSPRAYRTAGVVFALSFPFADIARRAGARRVEVVPNGIDPADIGLGSESPVQAPRVPGEPLRLLYVGRLAVEKGLVHLLDALTRLKGRVTLDLVGGGPLEGEVRRQIAARELTAAVRLLGSLPRKDLGAVYSSHHLFVTPALSEPFASVITEALASGLPVIGTNVGGIPDVVRTGFNGMVVPPADGPALAQAIASLEQDEALRRAMAANARASVLPRFAWETVGDRIAGVIRSIVADDTR